MKLIVLDPLYLNKRHISKLKKIGRTKVYKTFPNSEKEILQRIKNANIVITFSPKFNGELLQQCRSLKMLCLACSGCDRVDIDACNKLGIIVTNVPSYATEAVAEHTFALLLTLMKKIREGDQRVRRGDFNRKVIYLSQLYGKVFGIIGTGRIGSLVVKIANCFGCKAIATTLHPSIDRENRLGVKYVDLDDLLRESDIISLHLPLTPLTDDLINFKEFSLMKKRPILINTSRGKIINHSALVQALSKDMISGAGLDVLPPYEPPQKEDLLLRFPNVVFSPHNAFCTPEALEHRANIVIANIEAFIKGEPQNMVVINKQ